MGLAVSFTEGHVYDWGVPFATRILGEARAESIDNAPQAIHRNVVWTMNSDYATTDIQPLRYIQTAVTRVPLGASAPLGPSLSVSVEQALQAMTINGAKACQLDDRIGTIELGKDADLVELGADPVTVTRPPLRLFLSTLRGCAVSGSRIHSARTHIVMAF